MGTRVAVIAIIIENSDAVNQVNEYLHKAAPYIIGRMGIPYREKEIHIISIAMDAPLDCINALAGKIGRIPGISSKIVFAN